MRDETMKSWIRGLGLVLSSILTAYHSADAQPSGETMNPVTISMRSSCMASGAVI
jgi:hypothetical protein